MNEDRTLQSRLFEVASFPIIPDEFIAALWQWWPVEPPDISENPKMVWIRAGKQDVLSTLESYWFDQNYSKDKPVTLPFEKFPLIPKKLMDAIKERWPLKPIDIIDSEKDIWIEAGRQYLIMDIEFFFIKQQQKGEIDNVFSS